MAVCTIASARAARVGWCLGVVDGIAGQAVPVQGQGRLIGSVHVIVVLLNEKLRFMVELQQRDFCQFGCSNSLPAK